MPVIQTPAVFKPSAGSRLWGWADSYISAEDEWGVTLHSEGYAFSDHSIQNGVRCQGWQDAVGSAAGAGVTNGGAHIAHWSLDRYLAKTASGFSVNCGVKIWGETVSGWAGYNNGSWTGSSGSPLAEASQNIWVPALAAAGTPGVPTISPSVWNVIAVTCPAVPRAISYRLMYVYTGGNWTQYGIVNPGQRYSIPVVANRRYRVRYDALGPDGVWRIGAESALIYTLPSNPSGLTASSSGGRVSLSWATNAFMATSVQIYRSKTPDFASQVTVYNGPVKTSHVDSPPSYSGVYYYRVRVIAAGGTTGYSNVAAARAISAPSVITDLVRVAPWNDNKHTLNWKNNATTNAPYSSIELHWRTVNPVTAWSPLVVLPGTADSYTTPDLGFFGVQFQVRARNAADISRWTTLPMISYGAIRNPVVSRSEAIKSVARAVFGYTASPFPASTAISKEVQVSISDDLISWTSWVAALTTDSGSEIVASYSASKAQYVKFRCRLSLTSPTDGNVRQSPWVESPVIQVTYDPEKASITYDKDTYTATISLPEDDLGGSAGRDVYFYVDGVLADSFTGKDGSAQTIDVGKVIPASRFTLVVGVKTAFSPNEVKSDDLVVDLDTTQVIVDEKRHLVWLIYEDGKMLPCSVSIVR